MERRKWKLCLCLSAVSRYIRKGSLRGVIVLLFASITPVNTTVVLGQSFSLQVESLEVLEGDFTTTSAILRGRINQDAGDSNCWCRFLYFKKADGSNTGGATEKQTLTTVNGTGEFYQLLDGLESGCIYRFQAFAGNSVGMAVGAYLDFTTTVSGPSNILYVDDDAIHDPGPNDLFVSDPKEDGSLEHPYDSIQKAIDVADDQVTVRVREGRYVERLNFKGKTLDVIGFDVDSPAMTSYPIIDANDQGTCVTFNQGEDANCLLSGFVLTRGYGDPAAAIACVGSSPTIRHCLVVGNRCSTPNAYAGVIPDPKGSVIYLENSHSLIENCTIADNYGDKYGVGLFLADCSVVIKNSILWNNLPDSIHVASGLDPAVFSTCQETDPEFALPGYWTDLNDPFLLPLEPNNPDAIWLEGDYHLQSQGGRCADPGVGDWVNDEVTSPCIDRGDTDQSVGLETDPHGDRINAGAYGGTWMASRTPASGPVPNMMFESINDPGAEGHEGFKGLMSRFETTNAQYCQYLNAALASGDVRLRGNDIMGVNGDNSGADYVGVTYYNGDGSGYTYNGATHGGAAHIYYTADIFSVDPDFDDHPVTYVSWYGANAFVAYYGCRLPTEWEWQAVADYDGSYTHGCGLSVSNAIANYLDSIHPHGTTPAGSFGIYGYNMGDMSGNAWEWTASVEGSSRVFRGGGWNNYDHFLEVWWRYTGDPSRMYHYVGFRVCR